MTLPSGGVDPANSGVSVSSLDDVERGHRWTDAEVNALNEEHPQGEANVGGHVDRILVGEHLHKAGGTLAFDAPAEAADPGERVLAMLLAVAQAGADGGADLLHGLTAQVATDHVQADRQGQTAVLAPVRSQVCDAVQAELRVVKQF